MLYTIGLGQVEGSLFLWEQDRTDRILFGFEVPAAWFAGLPALLVVILAPAQLARLPRIRLLVAPLGLSTIPYVNFWKVQPRAGVTVAPSAQT